MKRLLVTVVALMLAVAPALAETYVTDDITSSTSWTLAGSPYIIQAHIEVLNSTLTIQAGVTVAFDGDYYLRTGWFGAIIATGVSGNEILFTSNAPSPTSSDWTWVQVGGTNPSSFSYCTFEYAMMGLRANNADPTISHCTFRRCSGAGLWISSACPTVQYCDIYENRDGIQITDFADASDPMINHNNIYDNTLFNVRLTAFPEPAATINCEYNWWGTDVEAEIAQEIRDSGDDPAIYATIDYDPWLHEIPVEASSWGRVKALFAR